jgi:hypothetical protein
MLSTGNTLDVMQLIPARAGRFVGYDRHGPLVGIGSAVAILNIGAVYQETDHQSERVDDDVALAALDLLAASKPWIPPLSVVCQVTAHQAEFRMKEVTGTIVGI